jgi:CspA family cold shock protein
MEGYRTLKAGQAVMFNILQGPKGLHAVEIRPQATVEAPAQTQVAEKGNIKAPA